MQRTSHAVEDFLRNNPGRPAPLDPKNPAGIFIKPLNEYPQSPMTSEQSRMFMSMNLIPESDVPKLAEDLKDYFAFQVLQGRLKMMGVEVTVPVMAFLSVLFPKPGEMVAFAHAIYHSKRRDPGVLGKPYDMTALAYDFPEGFPNEKIFEFAWDSQKVKGADNGYDLHYIFKATKDNPWIDPVPGEVEA